MVKTATFSTKLASLTRCFSDIRLLLIVLLFSLTSCSSNQGSDSTDTTAQTDIEEIAVDEGTLSAMARVTYAQTLPSDEAVIELIIASKLFFQQQDYVNALWLSDKTLPLIDEQTPKYLYEKIQLTLIKATSLQKLGYYAESHTQLEALAQFTSTHKIPLSATYHRLLSNVFQHKKRPVAALNALLLSFALTEPAKQTQEQIDAIWHHFQGLSQWQLKLLALDNTPDSDGWLQLTAIANKYGDQQPQMQNQLKRWQKKFPLHPANTLTAQLSNQIITIKDIKNIAVILPLSGKQKSAGLTIQQGILASFDNNKDRQLHFIDSDTVNWYALNDTFAQLQIDYVIGPLLKPNVEKYISHTGAQIQAQNEYLLKDSPRIVNLKQVDGFGDNPQLNLLKVTGDITVRDSDTAINDYSAITTPTHTIPTLLLNIPTDTSLTQAHTVLSMRPEDEANQAATTLSRKNYKHPIVLSQNNIVSKRIAQAFVKQWHRITGNAVDIVYYDSGAQMQANITASLSVDKSKARINKLKSRLNQSIKSQTRNRQDIDMIYLVGTPEQTRLVKPYIEVNISPFAQLIPVFASSRSHSTKSDYSSNSDLRGLTFTEIPWLLFGEKNAQLSAMSQQLWPKRSDAFSRLFAMGYDSYKLVNKIPLMQQAPYLQYWGQTGVFKLGENSILTRSLLWGEYQRNKVVSIAME